MLNEFTIEYEKAKKKEKQIIEEFEKRRENQKNRHSTGMIDSRIKSLLEDYEKHINTLKQLPLKSEIITPNAKPQNKLIEELTTNFFKFKKELTLNDSKKYKERSSNNLEMIAPKEPTHYERQKMLKEKDQKIDEEMDQLGLKTKKIKQYGREMKDVLNASEPLLNKMENNFSRIEQKMKKTENKLANYLQKSSDSCLYYSIIVLFILMIILVLI